MIQIFRHVCKCIFHAPNGFLPFAGKKQRMDNDLFAKLSCVVRGHYDIIPASSAHCRVRVSKPEFVYVWPDIKIAARLMAGWLAKYQIRRTIFTQTSFRTARHQSCIGGLTTRAEK
jgi:hypothetical protein